MGANYIGKLTVLVTFLNLPWSFMIDHNIAAERMCTETWITYFTSKIFGPINFWTDKLQK